ncbi:MAG TPA: hypothetical protein VH951_06595 [Dehalococcoidia bacterium]
MASLDVAIARSRPAVRPLTLLSAAVALGWIAFLSLELATQAYKLGKSDRLLHGLHLIPELKVMFGAAAICVAVGAAVAVGGSRALAWLKLYAVLAAAVSMAVLALESHQTGEVVVFGGLVLWCWWVGAPLLAALVDERSVSSRRSATPDGPEGSSLLYGAGRVALEVMLGLAVLSFALLAIALPGELTDAGMGAVLAVGAALAAAGWIRWRPLRRPHFDRDLPAAFAFIEFLALALLLVTLVVSFGASLAPQVQFDALHYHFAMPRIFLADGRFVERPDITQGYFPLGLEMTYTPALRFGGESAMTLMNWITAPALAALVWGGADRHFGRPSGAIAASLIGMAALVTFEASSASSDLAMTAWLVAAAVALAAYVSKPSVRLALVTGLFGGLALTFKIVAGIYVIPLALAFLAALLVVGRHWPRPALSEAASFGVGGAITGLPWLLMRWIQTGNPVFPLYNDVFQSDKWPPVRERFDLWLYGVGHSAGDAGSVWWELAAHPWRFGQWLPPWSMGLPALAFLAAVLMAPGLLKDRPGATMALLAVLAAGSWFLLSQYHRYGLPAVALLAIVAGGGIWAALRQLPRPVAAAAGGALLSVWFAGGLVLTLVMGVPDPYPSDVLLGHENRQTYRDRSTADYFPLQFVENATRGTDEAAAIVGYPYNYFVTNRVYDYTQPPTLSPFSRVALSSETPDQMARDLLASHVRWLIVDYNPVSGESPWPPAYLTSRVLSEAFLKAHTEVAFQQYGVVVYRILDP